MVQNSKYLFGKDHSDPTKYMVSSIGGDLAAGIASIVTKKDKKHNFADNEDASGIYLDDDVSICMVADAHWGYVASQEAVCRFPEIFMEHLRTDVKVDPRQVYLESILKLCEQVAEAKRESMVSYGEKSGRRIFDRSTSQFYSVVKVGRIYYFVGLGDCSCSIISPDEVKIIISQNRFFGDVGALDPRQYMRRDQYQAGLSRDAKLSFDDPLVRKGVDVQKLDACSGNVILLHTDGYHINTREASFGSLSQLFERCSVVDAVNEIMRSVVENRKQYGDNIAIAAVRVV